MRSVPVAADREQPVSGDLRNLVPWWARIDLKIGLSRRPLPHRLWKRLRRCDHGTMDRPSFAVATLLEHAQTAGPLDPTAVAPRFVARPGFTLLEIGPGRLAR